MKKKSGLRPSRILNYIVLTVFGLIALFPIVWAFTTSIKPESQIIIYPPTFIPRTPTLENYEKVLFHSNYPIYFLNTIYVTLISVIVAVVVASHAAYAFARIRFKLNKKLMFGVLMTSMIPAIAQLIPLYIMSVKVGLYNTRAILVIIYTAWRAPILTWLLKGFFEQLPSEIEEAGIVDGCSRVRLYYQIVLPMSRPGIASISLLSAVFVWNDYLVSSTFVSSEEHRMLSIGIYNYVTAYGTYWGQLMGGVVMASVPLIILFICLQKQFVAGLTAGAVKG